MKKLHLVIVGACLALTGVANAQTTDITVNNGIAQTSYGVYVDPRPGVNQLGSVNSGNISSMAWNLYAFGYDAQNQTLTYAGGFNPAGVQDTASNGTTYTYNLGDIFFSSPGQAITNPAFSDSQVGSSGDIPGTSQSYTNPGYSYAIHLGSVNGNTLSYSLLALNNNAQLLSTVFGVNQNANPYAVNTTVDLANGSAKEFFDGTVNIQNLTNYGVNLLLNEQLFNNSNSNQGPQDNYALTFNVANLLADASLNNPNLVNQGFNVSLAEQCGNDSLMGAFFGTSNSQAVPEPSSWALALLCTGSLVYLRRRAVRA